MKGLKFAFITVAALAVILIGVGFLLPTHVHVERSTRIAVSPERLFPYVNDFRLFNRWSPWAEIDPSTSYRFTGPSAGVGAHMSWASDHPNVGEGSQEIIESNQNQLVRVKLDFGSQGIATAYYALQALDQGTEITWGFDTEFGNDILGRYFGLMFENMVGPEYEKGLEKLKVLAENERGIEAP